MSSLKLFFLGPPQVELDGRPVEIKRRKGLALLAYLAVTGETQPRDTLATLFWPDSSQREARAALRNELWLLKETLSEAWLELNREAVTLRRTPDLWLDIEQFQQQTSAGQPHSGPAPPTDLVSLTRAVELYRDDFLTGFTLPHCPDFDEWQFFQTESFRQTFSSALVRLIQAHSLQGDHEAAIPYARRWLALDPLHEVAHRQLMQLYAQTGQPAAALRQYRLCFQLLQEELGISPSPETTALYDRIRSGDLSRGAREQGSKETEALSPQPPSPPSPYLPSPPAPRHNLPVQTTPFIGRETELAELTRLLTDPTVRLITIVGPGGLGKTRLALELAATQLDHFEHGVYFVRLGPLASVESIIPAIAEALKFSFHSGSSPEEQLHNYLREKQVLLLLDNYEHLLDPPSSPLEEPAPFSSPLEGSPPFSSPLQGPPSFSSPLEGGIEGGRDGANVAVDLLKAASGLKILATSRSRLNVREEQSFLIGGIDFPGEDLSQGIDQFSAVKLFLASARRICSDFALTAGDRAAMARICRLVQGMPLGLILAATWVALLTPAEIADELGHSLDFLTGDLRDLPKRQQSMRAVFDHSWRLLTEQEQAVFRQMSVFRGGFTREAAAAITGASLPVLRALVNKSLLQRAPTGRYEIHELLRQYAAEKLAGQPQTLRVSKTLRVFDELSELRDRHSAYYCAFLQEREADLKGARQQAALTEIETDGENARAAWHWAVERGQIGQIGQALESLSLFYLWRSRLYEGETMCRLAAEQLAAALDGQAGGQPGLGSPAQARVLIKILIWLSTFNRHLRQLEDAQQTLQQAQAWLDSPLFVQQDTRSEQAHLLLEQAEIASDINRSEAKDLVEQSLALYRSLEDQWRMAQGLELLGEAVRNLGQLDQARQLQEKALTLRQALEEPRGIARSFQQLGAVARHQGQFEESEQLIGKSISLFREIGDRNQLAHGVNDLGVTLAQGGKFAESLILFKESLEIYRDLGLPDEPGIPTNVSGFALKHLGQYQEARVYLQRAMTLYRRIGEKRGIGYILKNFGRIALAEKRYGEAQHLLQESLTVFRNLEDMNGLGQSLGILGYVALRLNNRRQAQSYIRENLQIAAETKVFLPLMTALAGVALLLADQGDKERAIEIYTLALQNLHVANSRWYEDVAGRYIAAAANTLPPEVVAAAQARGQARDLWATAAELLVELEKLS